MLQYQPYLDQLAKNTTETQALVNPHTKEEIARMPICKEEQMEEAIKRADDAFATLKDMPAHKRSDILNRASEILHDHKQFVAETIAQEAAKPMKYALSEVDRTVQTLKFSSVEARKLEGESIPMDAAPNGAGRDAYTLFEPIGVIGAITPFNFPLNLVVHKVGPAIASSNTVIVKPAEKTPLSAILLREVLVQAGLPEDAYHVVPGEGKVLGNILIQSDAVQKITFTGSPPVGREIKSNAGLKKVTLELGNNSALYVDKSMHDLLDDVASKAVHGSYAYNGQVCISTQRIYVHEDIVEDFTDQFVKRAEQLTFGDPLDEETDVCNLIDEPSQQRLLEWIEDAKQQGAKVLTGGEPKDNGIAPTVLTDVPEGAKVMKEEAFGPIVIINKVANSDEGLKAMNNSQYGLSAGLFSNDMKQAIEMAHGLEVGQALVNDVPTLRFDHMPYGGRKQSGYGYEGVKYAIHEMVNRKMISLNYTF